MSCKEKELTLEDGSEKDEAESAKQFTEMQQEDKIQETHSLVQKENNVCVREEPEISEGDNVLQQQTGGLEDTLQTAEGSEYPDMLGPELEALERLNGALISQIEQLPTSCKEDNLTSKDVSEKDKVETAGKVPVIQQEHKIQELDSLVQKEIDVCAQEELKISEGDSDLQQDTHEQEKKLLTEVSTCLDSLKPKLKAFESHNKVLSNEVKQLKMRYEYMAEKHMAEKREKEALQSLIRELNIKLQTEKDLCPQQQLKVSEREKILSRDTDDLQETFPKEHDDSKLQSWETEKKAYLQELEHVKLCYEGKTLRFHDMFEKLKAEKAHKEAIKEEQFKNIQALHFKVRQLQDFCTQQKLRASEQEKMLSLKLKELEEKISHCEEGARSNNLEVVDIIEEEASEKEEKPKKREGWKKIAYKLKPWHWGKK